METHRFVHGITFGCLGQFVGWVNVSCAASFLTFGTVFDMVCIFLRAFLRVLCAFFFYTLRLFTRFLRSFFTRFPALLRFRLHFRASFHTTPQQSTGIFAQTGHKTLQGVRELSYSM